MMSRSLSVTGLPSSQRRMDRLDSAFGTGLIFDEQSPAILLVEGLLAAGYDPDSVLLRFAHANTEPAIGVFLED
jgi:hypothetical protein